MQFINFCNFATKNKQDPNKQKEAHAKKHAAVIALTEILIKLVSFWFPEMCVLFFCPFFLPHLIIHIVRVQW